METAKCFVREANVIVLDPHEPVTTSAGTQASI